MDKQRLKIAEGEKLFELGNDHIVEAGDAAKNEEQRKHENAQVGRINALAFGLWRAAGYCHRHAGFPYVKLF